MTKNFKLSSVAAVLALVCQPFSAISAEQETADNSSSAPKTEKIEQIVVTGTFSGKAVRKVDAGYAISNFSEDDIKKLAPKSTADLFKAVPGVWSESSGGVAGANVFVRGFPSTGDAPFLTVQLQGAPIFPPPTLSFLENSSIFRLDETVEFMEALRGGTNPVISNGQPGLTTNFLLKEGSDDTEGKVKYSTSDFGLQRFDGVLSGALADDLYFMIGGYVKSSPGVRDAGFNAEEGQQFTINITKELDNGKINLYTRQTDDHGVWYLPAPINAPGVDNEYVQIGTNNRQATIQYGPDNTSEAFDFGDGRGWKGSVSGGSVELELDNGWDLVDRFSYTQGDANTFGLVPNDNAVALSSVADNGATAIGAVTGTEYAGDTMVQQIGRWVVKKEIEAFTNDLALTKTFDKGSFTAGYYNSTYQSKDWWSIGNQAYHVVETGGEMLTGIDCNDNADSCGWNYDINSVGDGTTRAVYGALSYEVTDKLTLDGGVRFEQHEIEYTVDEGLTGSISKAVSYDENGTSWTFGGNYSLTRDSGIFARISNGSKMPYFDDFRDNFDDYTNGEDLIKDVRQYELGYKLSKDNYSVYATGFFNEVEGDLEVPQPGQPAVVRTTQAYGVELDFTYYNDDGFSVSLNSTLQDTEILKGQDKGNELQRLPKWQVRITPSYEYEFSNGMLATVYGTLSAVGDRHSSNANIDEQELPGYEKVDLGVIFDVTDEVQVQFAANNLTDEDGLTEGDPRDALSSNARYILPRSFDFSVSYQF
ncbi:TonB-dependent receptor [Thalassomonas actiniarum]|uniref:TonB-dependent receptor n=1 Tax=Thalassomonas actiniarum TaxID=485447 RepID=A0AAE9YRU6_9GAMM|nr:TonB-dependent receptor [Thalassomonas actiniarum]WDD99283.1 TonB-dependent receptor [Thalassomonas actiniarum]